MSGIDRVRFFDLERCVSTNVDSRLDTTGASSFFSFVNATYGTSIPVPCH